MRSRRAKGWNDETGDRPRVVVECPPEASPSIIADVLERAGMAVRTCHGDTDRRCELIEHGRCSLVTGADVVVNLLGQHHENGRRIAEAVLAERRPPALVVEVMSPEEEACGLTPPAVPMIRPLRSEGLITAIRRALVNSESATPRWGT